MFYKNDMFYKQQLTLIILSTSFSFIPTSPNIILISAASTPMLLRKLQISLFSFFVNVESTNRYSQQTAVLFPSDMTNPSRLNVIRANFDDLSHV